MHYGSEVKCRGQKVKGQGHGGITCAGNSTLLGGGIHYSTLNRQVESFQFENKTKLEWFNCLLPLQ